MVRKVTPTQEDYLLADAAVKAWSGPNVLIRCHDAIEELAARWHRANEGEPGDTNRNSRLHTAGRMAGYEQAIALLLGVDARQVRAALTTGKLGVVSV